MSNLYTINKSCCLTTFSDCNQPHTLPGASCHAKIERYHWNNEVQVCVAVEWGGCRETKNNFASLEECEQIAKPVCIPEN